MKWRHDNSSLMFYVEMRCASARSMINKIATKIQSGKASGVCAAVANADADAEGGAVGAWCGKR